MNAVGLCALLGTMALAEPPPENQPMALTLLIPESESTPDLEAFLDERARETWDVGEPATTRFEVAIAWPAEQRLVVRVHEGERELASREIEVADPGAAKLTVWLVVKSTINRALLDGVPVEIATTVEPAVQRDIEPVVEKAPRRAWGLGALLVASVSRLELFSFGPTLVVWLNPWQRLVVTLEAGYRVSLGVNVAGQGADLAIHYVPVTASFGWQVDRARTWTAGAFATADVKIPVYENGSKMAAGLDLGGYLQALLPLTEHSRFFVRLFVAARSSRVRFLVDEGSITEAPVLGGLALGGLWQ